MGKSNTKGKGKIRNVGESPHHRRGKDYPRHLMCAVRFGYNNCSKDEVMAARAYVDEHGDDVSLEELHAYLVEWKDKVEAQRVVVGLPCSFPEEDEEEELMKQCWFDYMRECCSAPDSPEAKAKGKGKGKGKGNPKAKERSSQPVEVVQALMCPQEYEAFQLSLKNRRKK